MTPARGQHAQGLGEAASRLAEILRVVARPYRLPTIPVASDASPATALALAIEQARAAVEREEVPEAALKQRFIDALARLIHEAMRGDAAFQAMVLRHQAPQVDEYASLSASTDQDCRRIRSAVDAIAHPEKLHRSRLAAQAREALVQWRGLASSASWTAFADTAKQLLAMPEISREAGALQRLLEGPELARLQRRAALALDEQVLQYQGLLDRHGPRSGSAAAAAQGNAAQQRGAAVEALAAQALDMLAQRLNEAAEKPATYRVVTSMRVSSSIPGNAERAKTEWDAVLLRRVESADGAPVWDVCLLVEVKASVDAATTDFPRLLRGLQLLAQADEDAVYAFTTQQGEVQLRGASLAALSADEADLPRAVLYCCAAPADPTPRLLSAASRMQLLSADASLDFAGKLAEHQAVAAGDLDPVWQDLLASPRWTTALHQYALLRRVRALIVHIADLSAAIEASSDAS